MKDWSPLSGVGVLHQDWFCTSFRTKCPSNYRVMCHRSTLKTLNQKTRYSFWVKPCSLCIAKEFMCTCVGKGADGVKGKVRKGSGIWGEVGVKRSYAKGGCPRTLGGWVYSNEVNSAAVLSAYLRLQRGGDVETLPVEGTQAEVGVACVRQTVWPWWPCRQYIYIANIQSAPLQCPGVKRSLLVVDTD